MFKLVKCAENTYYLNAYAKVGLYVLDSKNCVLIDSGDHKKSISDLKKQILDMGLNVLAVFLTHCHLDHTLGALDFYKEFGAKIYATEIEDTLSKNLVVQKTILYNSIPQKRDYFGGMKTVDIEILPLTRDVLPKGFDMISLPGHFFNMVGIKTPDDVWFLADSVLSRETYESYKIPFCMDPNKAILTCERLKSLNGSLFVPSHTDATDDITPLATLNQTAQRKIKELVLSLADQRTFEELLTALDNELGLSFTFDKYAKVTFTLKGVLQALIDDGVLTAELSGARLIYKRLD